MSLKEQVIAVIGKLPDDVTLEEIIACIESVPAVMAADREIDEGRGLEHQEVIARLRSR